MQASKGETSIFAAHAGYLSLDRADVGGRGARSRKELAESAKQNLIKLLDPRALLKVGSQEVVNARLGVGLQQDKGRADVQAVLKEGGNSSRKLAGLSEDFMAINDPVDRSLRILPAQLRQLGP